MNEEGAAALSNGLRSLTELEVLDISHSPLGSAVTVIAAHLQSTPCLTELNMNKTEMGWDEAAPVASSLKFLQNLRMLSIGSNPFERGVHVLVQHLCKIPKLKRLDLTSVVMGDEEANLVSNAFKKIRTLTITTDYLDEKGERLPARVNSSSFDSNDELENDYDFEEDRDYEVDDDYDYSVSPGEYDDDSDREEDEEDYDIDDDREDYSDDDRDISMFGDYAEHNDDDDGDRDSSEYNDDVDEDDDGAVHSFGDDDDDDYNYGDDDESENDKEDDEYDLF